MTARTQRIELITRGERRRRWSIEEKREIVAESLRPGVRPSEIIQRHGITSGQLYAWRQQLTRRVGGELARQITEVLWGRGERAITQKALSLGLRKTGNQAVRGGERDVLNLRRPVDHNMVVPRGQRGQLTVQYRLGQPDHREYRLARAQRRPIERTALGIGIDQQNREPPRARAAAQQREARERLDAGETQRSVARSYNVSQATISRLAA